MPLTQVQIARTLERYTWHGPVDASAASAPGESLAGVASYTRVGDIITATANGALPAIDGRTGLGEVYLVNEPDPINNGAWAVVAQGDGANPFVLQRVSLTAGGSALGYTVKPYPWIGSQNEDYLFVCITPGPVNTGPLRFVRLHFSTLLTNVDAARDTWILTRSGQRVRLMPRDELTLNGGDFERAANTSFTVPAAGRILAPPVRSTVGWASGQLVEVTSQEEYLDLAGAAQHDVSFTIPDGAEIQAVMLTWSPGAPPAGPATYDLGWSDAATAFVAGAAVGVNQSRLLALTRSGGPGTIRLSAAAPWTAGRVQIAALWRAANNPGTVFF